MQRKRKLTSILVQAAKPAPSKFSVSAVYSTTRDKLTAGCVQENGSVFPPVMLRLWTPFAYVTGEPATCSSERAATVAVQATETRRLVYGSRITLRRTFLSYPANLPTRPMPGSVSNRFAPLQKHLLPSGKATILLSPSADLNTSRQTDAREAYQAPHLPVRTGM